jgi:hypothetical protein
MQIEIRTGLIKAYFDTKLDSDIQASKYIIFRGNDEQQRIFRCYEKVVKLYTLNLEEGVQVSID